jgi:hypothetical protein
MLIVVYTEIGGVQVGIRELRNYIRVRQSSDQHFIDLVDDFRFKLAYLALTGTLAVRLTCLDYVTLNYNPSPLVASPTRPKRPRMGSNRKPETILIPTMLTN